MNDENQEFIKYYDHIGNNYQYVLSDDKTLFYHNFENAISNIEQNNRFIDNIGIISVVNKGYLLGNRTLVKGIERTPWMGRPNGRGGWIYADIPQHEQYIIDTELGAKKLKNSLKKEALKYLEGKKRIAILLSGGMDSRIVAGIVKELQISEEFGGEVVGITWGINNCRDVIYASQIADRFNWEWIHLPLSPESLRENIFITGEMGAEFAPFHLHALPQILKIKEIDAVLAGSYGDGVGRAEFSGVRFQNLKRTVPSNLNRYGLLFDPVIKESENHILKDAFSYRKHVSRSKEYEYREIEYQMHCIRRRTQGVMSFFNCRIPIYQMYTSQEVVKLMWSFHPAIRDDRFYGALLKLLPKNIYDIPWARTGLLFGDSQGKVDNIHKEHNKYGQWLRNDLNDFILPLINNSKIRELGVFNNKSLDWLIKVWPKAKTITTNSFDELISWMASLSIMINKYEINPSNRSNFNKNEYFSSAKGLIKTMIYLTARNHFRE